MASTGWFDWFESEKKMASDWIEDEKVRLGHFITALEWATKHPDEIPAMLEFLKLGTASMSASEMELEEREENGE